MIHYKYQINGTGSIGEGLADRIKVHYTPDNISIHCLDGPNYSEFVLVLGREWEPNTIFEFSCDKFNLKAG